jgi:hypothetical protein
MSQGRGDESEQRRMRWAGRYWCGNSDVEMVIVTSKDVERKEALPVHKNTEQPAITGDVVEIGETDMVQ